jgi:hypothetical protein
MPTQPVSLPSTDDGLWICRCLLVAGTLLAGGCQPYPDDGEFLAGVVYSANFVTGVRQLNALPAVGRGNAGADFAPYTLISTSQGSATTTPVSSSVSATSPFWTDGKRKPLARTSAQQVYVLDSKCVAPDNYTFDERLDLIRKDVQYPIFADIPEVLSTNSGKAGRLANYSAVVEVIHVTGPSDLPCQSMKRFDTAKPRVGQDLIEVRREFRLLQIIDPSPMPIPPATPPSPAPVDATQSLPKLPVQLGFYNQLVVPYIDMGPVPLSSDGSTFLTMPLYKVTNKKGQLSQVVVGGTTLDQPEQGSPVTFYSPICQDYTLSMVEPAPPPDLTDPAYAMAKKTDALSSCLVCRTVDSTRLLDCPFRQSMTQVQGMP